jgi:hypothetical protein
VYTNPDGTLTVPAGTDIDIPIAAQQIGAASSAPAFTLTLTTSLVGCSATNANAILGNDREDADTYRGRCTDAAGRLSFDGPADAYAYFAAKNIDGTPLLNDAVPPAPSGITRAQVTQKSDTGIVNAYFASATGPAIPDDVSAANKNIRTKAIVVPDAITYTGVAASQTTIHVVGTAKFKARIGVTAQQIAEGIVASLVANGKKIPIGGVDQDAGGNGVVYTSDLEGYARSGFEGVYNVVVSTPAGASTAMLVGHVPVIQSAAGDGLGSGDWTVTIVP